MPDHNHPTPDMQTSAPHTNVRNVVASLFISLDGVTEAPEQWQFEYFDADMEAGMIAQMEAEDTVILGRRTYEIWSAFYPTNTELAYAHHVNRVPKYVVSNSLDSVSWGSWDNVSLLNGNLAEEIARLKQQPGKNISIPGSATLVRSMLQDDLIDELVLLVHPVIVGRGTRLFDDWSGLKRMQLVHSTETRSGVMILSYRPQQRG